MYTGLFWTAMPRISDSMRMVFEAVDAYIDNPENQVDSKRIYVMGLSMGGYGTWDAIQRKPDFFAAASPFVAGVIRHWLITNKTPHMGMAWELDKVIKPSRSSDMIDAISKSEVPQIF